MARVLLLTHIYPPAIDGGSKIISKIAQYLQKQGHQILVVTSNCTSSDDFSQIKHSTLTQSSPQVISLPVITIFHRPLKLLSKIFPSLKTFSKGPIFSLFPFCKSLKTVLNFHPDYIVAGPLPTTIILYARFFHYLSTHLLHLSTKFLIIPCLHPQDKDFQTPILISTLKKSDFIWCLTNYEKKYLRHRLKITKAKYFVSGLGVDSDFIININKIRYPKEPNLLFIANFSAHKKTELLISAFYELSKQNSNLSLTLLGQKTLYFPQIKMFLKKIPLSARQKINFIFNPTQAQIKKSIDQSSCLILPSIHESFGLVFVESLARGKPIIGTSTPQSLEVIQTLGGGLTFKTNNLQSLINTTNKLIKSLPLSQKLSLTGYQTVKNSYTWDKIGKNLCKKLAI